MISSLADHALLYALAMLVHLVWYAWPARPITAQGLHRFLYTLGIKLNRKKRSAASLVWRGLIILLLILATATAAGYGLSLLARLAPPYSWAMEVIILAWLLRLIPAQQRLIHLSRALREQGERPTTELAHRFEPMRDQPVDAYAALRRGAEDAVRAYTDLFLLGIAYLLGGLTVFVPLACLSLCALFYGRSTRETLAFGWAASRLWGGLLWPFERLAAAWLCFAALIAAQCHPVKAWAGLNHWVGCRLRYQCVFATAADACNIALGGPYREHGEPVAAPWLGKGTAMTGLSDVLRLQWLLRVATALYALAMLGLALSLSAF